MKRVLFILSSNEFKRNYLESNSLRDLSRNCELHLLILGNINVEPKLTKIFKSVTNFNLPNKSAKSQVIYDLYTIRYRKVSSSFKYRVQRRFPNLYWQYIYLKSHPPESAKTADSALKSEHWNTPTRQAIYIRNVISLVSVFKRFGLLLISLIKGKIVKFLYYGFGSTILFLPVVSILKRLDTSYDQILDKFLNFDAVFIPSSGYEHHVPAILKKARKYSIFSVLLIDNWDNLSSKSILWEHPDLLACWGQQSIEHAINIQGIPRSKCIAIGTPRFSRYYDLRDADLLSEYPHDYILFCGSSVPYGEAQFLQELDAEVYGNPVIYGNTRIIYRPHPLRGGWEQVEMNRLRMTDLDEDLKESFLSGQIRWNRTNSLPPLERYPSLIQNANVVISGLTSMMLEASIFRKNCIVLAFDEPKNLTNPRKIMKEYLHFEGIERLPNLTICTIPKQAIQEVRTKFGAKSFDQTIVDSNLKYFLHYDLTEYQIELTKILSKLSKND